MSIKLSSLLKLSVAGAVLLSVGACKAADKGQGALKSESIAALNLSKSEASVFSKHFATDPCDVDEMEALGALAGLGLGENGTNGVKFASRDFNDNRVTYRDLTLTEDGSDKSSFVAGTAVFHCAQMGEESPSFNRVDLSDIVIKNEADAVEITAETLNIANPSSEAARSIVGNMTQLDSNSVNDGELGAFSITGVKIKSDEMSGTVNALSWGETRDEDGTGLADLTVEDVNLIIADQNGHGEITVDFDGMSARNLNVGVKTNNTPNLSPNEAVNSFFDNMNSFEKPYDEFIMGALKVDSKIASVDFAGLEGTSTEKGDLITSKGNLKPMVINLKPAFGEDPSMAQAYGILQSLDMETITLSGSSVTQVNKAEDSVSVTDGLFVIDDVMRWNFEYDMEGVAGMVEKLQNAGASGANSNILENFDALKLRSFRMTIEDNSIVSKGLKLATEMTGQSEKNLKLMLTGAVFFAASAAENDVQAEVYSETVEAFSEFVKNGGTLTIEANPPEPFSLVPLFSGKGADVDPDTLGFSASQAGGTE